jgi:hypothetical protein
MIPTISKKYLRQWLSESRTHRVLVALAYCAEKSQDAELQNAVLLQEAQWADWKRTRASGTLSQDELTALRNRIHAHLAYSIDELPEEGPLSITPEIFKKADEQDAIMAKSVSNFKNWAWLVGGILAVIVVYALIKNQGGGTFTQTIVVKDKKGELILQNQGKVVLNSTFGLDSAKIGDNGEATMNLTTNFLGTPVQLRISHPQPYQVIAHDSSYIFEKNKPITLIVALQNLDKIFGRILDEENSNALEGVRVSIQNLETLTDKNGWFELTIPIEKQAQFQNIRLEKKGFQSEQFDDTPIHTRQELNWALKSLKIKSKNH